MEDMNVRLLAYNVSMMRGELRDKCDTVAGITLEAHKLYEAASTLSLSKLEGALRELIMEGQSFLCTYRKQVAIGDWLHGLSLEALEICRKDAEDFISFLKSNFEQDTTRFHYAYENALNLQKAIRCAAGNHIPPYWEMD